jgi:SAM-dependent methyltransferase
MRLRDNCPVCGSQQITTFLIREQTPAHQNLVITDQQAARQSARGDLTLGRCETCGFVFNRTFDLALLGYGENYDNSQMYSPAFSAHVDGLLQHLLFDKGVQNCRIVEVGCGQGTFLRRLVDIEACGNTGYGFDPSYSGPDVDLGGRLLFEKRYYGPDSASIPADVVICRHVIEHVPEPLELLRAVRQALANSPRARVFFETPDVEWILQHQVIWDFFYEHCSYFTAEALSTAFELAGFQVESVTHVFGGQYLWLEATPATMPSVNIQPGRISELTERFSRVEGELRQKWLDVVQSASKNQKIALWGAGAKGVTFANLIDPARRWIMCVVDLNPNKQGRYIPGVGHPIVGYQDLTDLGVTAILIMNPNYREEILKLLHEANLDINLIDLGEL